MRTLATNRQPLKRNYEITSGTLFEGFESLTGWARTSAGGSAELDAVNVKNGTNSIKLIPPAGGGDCFYDKTISANLSDASRITFWLYIPTLTGLNHIAFYLSSVTNYSKFFSVWYDIAGGRFHKGWNVFSIPRSEWGVTGSEAWTNTFQRFRVRMNGTGGTSVSFDSVYTKSWNRAKCIITFDDSMTTAYTEGYTYMATKGLKGTMYNIRAAIDNTGGMTLAQAQTMYDAGWDMSLHGATNLTTFTYAEMMADIAYNKQFLLDNGFTRNNCHKHYAYPNGGYNDTVLQAMADSGMTTARTIIDTTQSHYVEEPYLLSRQGIFNTTTIAEAKAYVDLAIARGEAILLNFHQLVASPTVDTQWSITNFQALMDYIKQKQDYGFLDVVTISEWYNGL